MIFHVTNVTNVTAARRIGQMMSGEGASLKLGKHIPEGAWGRAAEGLLLLWLSVRPKGFGGDRKAPKRGTNKPFHPSLTLFR